MAEFTHISPTDLAHAIADCSLSTDQKLLILRKLSMLSADRIEALYEALINLKTVEQEFLNDSQRTDLKYRMEFINEIEKEKQKEKKQ
jgi:hypothetical protein